MSQVLWHLVLVTMIMFHKRLKTSKSGHFDTGVKGDKNTVCLKNGLPTLSNFDLWWGEI